MIDGVKNSGIATAAAVPTGRGARVSAERPAKTEAPPPAASVLASLAQPTAPVDQARIDDLRTRIGDGSYRPDPAAIAKAMIERDASS